MGDVTRCPKCCSVVRSEAAHCPMCGADIPPQRQFGMLGVPGQAPCAPPPPSPSRNTARVPAAIAIGCLALAVVMGAWVLNMAGKIIRRPETIVNKLVDQGARDTAEQFFKRLDAGDFEAAWGMGDSALHSATTLREFRAYMFALRARYGPRMRPVIRSVKLDKKLLNGKSSTTHSITFETEFQKGKAHETLVILEQEGRYSVHSYQGPSLRLARRAPRSPGGRGQSTPPGGGAAPLDSAAAEKLAARFLDAMNSGAARAWGLTGDGFRDAMDRTAFDKLVGDIKSAHGKRLERRAVGFNSTSMYSNGQALVTVSITFQSRFERGAAMEEVTLEQTPDGPVVAFYAIMSDSVATPDIQRPDPFQDDPEPMPETPEFPQDRGLEI